MSRIIVQKFGGTSLQTPEGRENAVQQILTAKEEGFQVVVVASAMGRSPDPYATDTLLSLLPPVKKAGEGSLESPPPGEKTGGGMLESRPPSERSGEGNLSGHPSGSQGAPSTNNTRSCKKVADALLSCGEVISSAVLTSMLQEKGDSAEILLWTETGIFTDENFGEGDLEGVDTSQILSLLSRNATVVIPGFQGTTREGAVTTLGRGGSDITACVLGVVLQAERVEIFTDVDGVKTADPRILEGAETIPEITYEEVGEMACHGARVLHPKSVTLAMLNHLPVVVKSALHGAGETRIVPITDHKRLVSGIAHVPHVSYVRVTVQDDSQRVQVFESFATEGVSLDLISVNPDRTFFIIQERETESARKILTRLSLPFEIQEGFAKVSCIGAGMRGRPGVMFRIVKALQDAGVTLCHSTDSHISISLLVRQKDLKKAVSVLARAFALESRSSTQPACK